MIRSKEEMFSAIMPHISITHPFRSDMFVVKCDDVYQRGVVLRYLADMLGLHLDQCLYRDGFVYPDDHSDKYYPNVIVYSEAYPDATRSTDNLIHYRDFVRLVGLVCKSDDISIGDDVDIRDLKLPPVSSLLFDQQLPVAAGFPGQHATHHQSYHSEALRAEESKTPSQTERRPVYET